MKSGAKIASSIDFTRDTATGALVVRHDDSAPNVYHALEVWTSTKGARAVSRDDRKQRRHALV